MTDNREAWLERAVAALRPDLEAAGYPVPPRVRVACGFPSTRALSQKKARVGECWDAKASADGANEILISPRVHEPVLALDVLVHELGHAAVGLECGHKGPFRKFMRAVGLEGKPTSTHAGERLRTRLDALAAELGPYPHSAFTALQRAKKQTTRLVKCECPECGYTVRTTTKWLEVGPPHCPEHGAMEIAS